MTDVQREKVEQLVAKVRTSACGFYRAHWGKAERFEDLPLMDVERFIATPFGERTYKVEKGLVKIVRAYRAPFLVHWSLEDLKAEQFGDSTGKRPLVLLSDSHEALEKSLWFYEHDILPLIGEPNNPPVVSYAANKYDIDALVTDDKAVPPFLSEHEKQNNMKAVAVVLIGSSFEPALLRRLESSSKNVTPVLSLPETGTFGMACPKNRGAKERHFHPSDNSVLEIKDGELIVTKLVYLRTPVIRYRTGIRAEQFASGSDCGESPFRLVS